MGAEGGKGGGGANPYGTVHQKNTVYQQWPGPGLKRSLTQQEVAENRQDTGTEMADAR